MRILIRFEHGLGDSANLARMIPLYTRRGHEFEIQCPANKRFFFESVGAKTVAQAGTSHPWLYPDTHMHVGLGRGWAGNKCGCNLSRAPLPHIGERDELWEEYKASDVSDLVRAHISQDGWARVDTALDELPRPIVLLHAIGTTSQRQKSLPSEFHVPFYRALLERFEGTLILLDWDNRMPRASHYRVRHHPDHFGELIPEDLLALMFRSDLLMGVDSGPLHTASLTDIPAVGIWPHPQYVSTYLVPRPRTLNVVCSEPTQQWNRFKRAEFQIVEHPGRTFDPEQLAEICTKMLRPPRYLPDECPRARDVQLQQFVREFCRSHSVTHELSDIADRNHSFDLLLREARRRFESPRIVETGCIRAEEDWAGAGFSTYLFGLYAQASGGHLDSVDLNPQHCQFARNWTAQWADAVTIHESRGDEWLRSGQEPIDILYLDSVDTDVSSHAQECLVEFQAALSRLHEESLVLIDDTPFSGGDFIGKGSLAVPYALQNGWQIGYAGYQVLLQR